MKKQIIILSVLSCLFYSCNQLNTNLTLSRNYSEDESQILKKCYYFVFFDEQKLCILVSEHQCEGVTYADLDRYTHITSQPSHHPTTFKIR